MPQRLIALFHLENFIVELSIDLLHSFSFFFFSFLYFKVLYVLINAFSYNSSSHEKPFGRSIKMQGWYFAFRVNGLLC